MPFHARILFDFCARVPTLSVCFSPMSVSRSDLAREQEVIIMDLVVDCAYEIGPLDHFWRSTGFSPADLLLTKDMQQQMACRSSCGSRVSASCAGGTREARGLAPGLRACKHFLHPTTRRKTDRGPASRSLPILAGGWWDARVGARWHPACSSRRPR